MEAFRKLRDQVARQQQAVLKQFGGGAFGSSENISLDESELRQHHKIEKLYASTRACKHFQRDVVRGLEGYIVTGSKQVEIGNKMGEDSRKYGAENTCTSGNSLTKAAFSFSRARTQMVKEQEHLLRVYGTQMLFAPDSYVNVFWPRGPSRRIQVFSLHTKQHFHLVTNSLRQPPLDERCQACLASRVGSLAANLAHATTSWDRLL